MYDKKWRKIGGLLLSTLIMATFSFADSTDNTIQHLLNSCKPYSLSDKMVKLSSVFFNVPYQVEPLGEGKQGEFNRQPLYRLDGFDCETFVNTVSALALAHNIKQFQQYMRDLTYQNKKISFVTRKHFVIADWLQDNIKQGLMDDMTLRVADRNDIAVYSIYINKKNWFKQLPESRIKLPHLTVTERYHKLMELHALSLHAKDKMVKIHYIPLQRFFIHPQLMTRIPQAAIIIFVGNPLKIKQEIGTDIDAVHMGFMIWKDSKPYLRAASLGEQRILDIPFLAYLHYNQDTVKGVMVLQLRKPSINT